MNELSQKKHRHAVCTLRTFGTMSNLRKMAALTALWAGFLMLFLYPGGSIYANKKMAYVYETIPFELIRQQVYINVVIDSENFRFLLDTGATVNVVSSEIANRFVSGREAEQGEMLALKTLSMGNQKFHDVSLSVQDLARTPIFDCLDIEGIIGLPILKTMAWRIDYRKKVIFIAARLDLLPPLQDEHPVSFTYSEVGLLQTTCSLAGKFDTNVILDTGYSGLLLLNESIRKKLAQQLKQLTFRTVKGKMGETLYGDIMGTSYSCDLPSIKMGSFLAENVEDVDFKDLDICGAPTCVIGGAFFRNFIVTLDFSKDRMLLKPVASEFTLESDQFPGFAYTIKKNCLYVSSLWMDSEAAKAGLEVGDRIMALNGKPVESVTSDDYCQLLKEKLKKRKRDTYSLLVKRKTEMKKFLFKRKG
ncbi:MAG: hypothetical protein GY765_02235 [bacterium]|nr:hypothetical protein [bacterium]